VAPEQLVRRPVAADFLPDANSPIIARAGPEGMVPFFTAAPDRTPGENPYMALQYIKVEVEDYIAAVVMDRPPVNAQNAQLRSEIMEVFDSFNDREDVRVAVLTGAGKVFSAGADIKERDGVIRQPGDYARHNRVAREYANCIRECAVPVIAAVNGPALGAGFGLMAACDIMLASDNAVFAMPEIDVGLAGGAAMLSHLVGKSLGRRILFTGERIPAQELYRLGIIERCVPREALMEEALRIARSIAAKSPKAMRLAKKAYNVCENMPQRDGYRFEQDITVELSQTEDAKEARRAFAEKRKPVFKGR
jgi:enoyl-CoA hydratase